MIELKKPSVLQLRHNNSDGFVYAYDREEMDAYISELDKVIAEKDMEIFNLKEELSYIKADSTFDRDEYEELLKSKDAEIVELKKACNDKDDWCLHTLKEIRHHNYKRCMAMAKWCKAEQTYSSFAIYITEHPESRWANKSVGAGNWIAFWKNREQRWLKIAEKFKEI